ncbi:hypothetical protein MKJ04_03560 [Pontibacter sp. E15-1]|uniref:hypothetical protein n=1 Tax=Pontibacter sp. E15-1 TaxID=2919918 RepID=UPI001F4FF5EC|nr:hypothetical protein [Pontibacter sp. E15-1]MCJ8163904.1 hypothetical protein [Pontibacter sp. E15-1]
MRRLNVRFADAALLLLYIAVCLVIVLRTIADETGYTTPDSAYYLELAENLRTGVGFYRSDEYPIPVEKVPQNQVYFTTWPVGYPVLITLTSVVTRLNVFWASKILNLLFLGLGFLLMRRISINNSYLLACGYCSYTMLAVYTYTWSEAPFTLGCLLLVYLLRQLEYGKQASRIILLLFLTGSFLFLMRYVGVFSFGVIAHTAGFYWHRGQHSLSLKLLAVALLLCGFAALYFCINYYFTGSFSGGDRLAGREPLDEFFHKQALGIVNEFFLIRKHYAPTPPDALFILLLAFQAAVTGAIVWLLRDDRPCLYFERRQTLFPRLCFLVAGLYFVFLLFLRVLSPFDPLDFRLLSPAVFLALVALLYYLCILPDQHRHNKRIKALVVSLATVSLLLNLPKQYVLDRILQLLP